MKPINLNQLNSILILSIISCLLFIFKSILVPIYFVYFTYNLNYIDLKFIYFAKNLLLISLIYGLFKKKTYIYIIFLILCLLIAIINFQYYNNLLLFQIDSILLIFILTGAFASFKINKIKETLKSSQQKTNLEMLPFYDSKIISEFESKQSNSVEINLENKKRTLLKSKKINFLVLVYSFVFSYVFLNFILRLYAYNNLNKYNKDTSIKFLNISENIVIIIAIFLLLLFISYFIFNALYKKIKINELFFIPFNSGINRIIFLILIVLSTYNEIIHFSLDNSYISCYDWDNIFLFNSNLNGLFIFISLQIIYLVFLWIYFGFKNSKFK